MAFGGRVKILLYPSLRAKANLLRSYFIDIDLTIFLILISWSDRCCDCVEYKPAEFYSHPYFRRREVIIRQCGLQGRIIFSTVWELSSIIMAMSFCFALSIIVSAAFQEPKKRRRSFIWKLLHFKVLFLPSAISSVFCALDFIEANFKENAAEYGRVCIPNFRTVPLNLLADPRFLHGLLAS